MINFFLRIKHWQLFQLLFVGPIAIQMILMMIFLNSAIETGDPQAMIRFFNFFPVIMFIIMFGYMGWIYSIGAGFQKLLPEHVKMPLKTFTTFLVIAGLNLVAFSVFITFAVNDISDSVQSGSTPSLSYLQVIPIFILTNLFSLFCIVYSFYFAAKTLKSVELQRDAYSEHYLGYLFLFWFSIIGIWIIQPKVNKLVEGTFQPTDPNKPINNSKDLLD